MLIFGYDDCSYYYSYCYCYCDYYRYSVVAADDVVVVVVVEQWSYIVPSLIILRHVRHCIRNISNIPINHVRYNPSYDWSDPIQSFVITSIARRD